MRSYLSLAVATLLSTCLFGQNTYKLPRLNFYDKATIGLVNFQKIQARNLSITKDSIRFSENNFQKTLSLEDINYIRVREGNKAKEGALIGGASMLIISLASIVQVESDPNYELKDNAGILVGLFTIGGTAIGAIIGSATSRDVSYYVHSK